MGKLAKKTKKHKAVIRTLAKFGEAELDNVIAHTTERMAVKDLVEKAVAEMKKHLTAQQAAFEIDAVQRFTTILLSVLHDKEGWGHDRLKRLVLAASERAVAVRETKTKLTDIQDMLRQETRIDICQDNCVSVLFGAKGVVVDDFCMAQYRSEG